MNIRKFLTLDFISIKPYITIKNIIIYIMIGLIVSVSSKNYLGIISMLIIFTSLYAAYPFAIGEQEGLNNLYAILKLSRKDIVQGRYAFLILLNISGLILSLLVFLLLSFILSLPIQSGEMLSVGIITTLIINLNYLIQYPILFKNGYMKSAYFIFLPMMIIVAVSVGAFYLFEETLLKVFENIALFIDANLVVSILVAILIWISLITISYRKSLKIYESRNL